MKEGKLKMKSIAEKKLDGTYRADRDKDKEVPIEINEQYIVSVLPPPTNFKNPEMIDIFAMTVEPVANLRILYQQDIVSIYNAFYFLDDAMSLRKQIQKLENKSLISKNLGKYNVLQKLYDKKVMQYESIMRSYFISPKERMKAFISYNQNKKDEIKKDAIDEVLAL